MIKSIKNNLKRTFDVSRWMGTERLHDNFNQIKDLSASLYKIPKDTMKRCESFEEAVARQNLTEADLQQRARNYKFSALLFATLTLPLGVYVIFLLFHNDWVAAFTAFMLMSILCTFAGREYMHFYQIKNRRLGCSFFESLGGLLGRKS